ncbi:MAG: hypothetical protein NC453_28960 [Muribaculum sp.]|nr:hypothetical protein [Muribaculum sp.]
MEYLIELNAVFVSRYKTKDKALNRAKELAQNGKNIVRVWSDEPVKNRRHKREIIWDSHE